MEHKQRRTLTLPLREDIQSTWATELEMRHSSLVLTAAAALVAGSATAQDACGRPSEIAGALTSPTARTGVLVGRSAAVCGQNWAAANIFETAVQERPTVIARFNLAAVYASTERYAAASELYRTVVDDGQFTTMVLDVPADRPQQRVVQVNAADEAARRLIDVESRIANDTSTGAIDPPEVLLSDTLADATAPTPRTALQSIIDAAHVPADRAAAFDSQRASARPLSE